MLGGRSVLFDKRRILLVIVAAATAAIIGYVLGAMGIGYAGTAGLAGSREYSVENVVPREEAW